MNQYTTNDVEPQTHESHHSGHGSHSWMMIACCIPMLIIAVALVVTGIASPGLVVAAIACTAVMAFMMRGMDHHEGERR